MRNQRNNVANVETCIDQVEIITLHVQILFHSTDIGIAQVESVQIVDPIKQTAEGKYEPVDLHQKFSLFDTRSPSIEIAGNFA